MTDIIIQNLKNNEMAQLWCPGGFQSIASGLNADADACMEINHFRHDDITTVAEIWAVHVGRPVELLVANCANHERTLFRI